MGFSTPHQGQKSPSTAAAVCSELPVSSCWRRERTRARKSRGCHWRFHYLSWQFSLLGNHTVTGECPHDDKNLPRWSALENDIESPPAPGSRSAVLQLWACFLSSLWELSKWNGDFSFFLPGVFMQIKQVFLKSSNIKYLKKPIAIYAKKIPCVKWVPFYCSMHAG